MSYLRYEAAASSSIPDWKKYARLEEEATPPLDGAPPHQFTL